MLKLSEGNRLTNRTHAPHFGAPESSPQRYNAMVPCRVADTRLPPGALGGPGMGLATSRTLSILSSNCGVPPTATAYVINVTVVPTSRLGFLTVWPTGRARPFVSTLNATTGTIVANLPAGQDGMIDFYATEATDLVVDIGGYFAPAGVANAAMLYYPAVGCRAVDTRFTPVPSPLGAGEIRTFAPNCDGPACPGALVLTRRSFRPDILGFFRCIRRR